MKEDSKKKLEQEQEPIYNPYLDMLSKRLVELREEKKITQTELAKATNTTRDKINFTEMRMSGRKLQIEELAAIAKYFNVTMEYLIGMDNSRTSTNGNGLTDEVNEIIKEWRNTDLNEIDIFIKNSNSTELMQNYRKYLIVSYVTEKLLNEVVTEFREKTYKEIDLQNVHIQKIGFLIQYIGSYMAQKGDDDNYYIAFTTKYKQEIADGWNEIGQLTYYNADKAIGIRINYNKIKKLIEILKEYQEYLEFKITKGIEDTINLSKESIINDDRYFQQIKKYYNEMQN